MKIGNRARRDQEIADLRGQVEELRNLATARLGVIDDLAEKVVELEGVVDALNTGLARHLEFHSEAVPAPIETFDDESAPEPAAGAEQAEADDVPPILPPAGGTPEDPERPAPTQTRTQETGRGATGRKLSEKQQALVAAVDELVVASTGEIARHVGREGQEEAVGNALKQLRDRGLVAHNGLRARAARWLPAPDAPAAPVEEALEAPPVAEPEPPAPEPPAAPAVEPAAPAPLELSDLDERIISIVREHGPVTSTWVADQVVKNRRMTGLRMRDLVRAGVLVDLDGAFAVPDLAEAA